MALPSAAPRRRPRARLGAAALAAAATAIVALAEAAPAAAPSCKDDAGADVDFAYVFKYPGGYRYSYMGAGVALAESARALDDDASSISQTLMQMHQPGISHVLWNDESPGKPPSEAPTAHSKGALVFSADGGFWLTHSWPKFPKQDAGSGRDLFADASSDFGQSFLCITVPAAAIHAISPALAMSRPTVYSSSFIGGAEDEFADVASWAAGHRRPKDAHLTMNVELGSVSGQAYTFFAKSGDWGIGKDLYRDLVAPALGPLIVESWRRGPGLWGPACGRDEVLDATEVAFPGDATWSTEEDHSKWAVTQSGSVLCVGDLNRADGQARRGGGSRDPRRWFKGPTRKALCGRQSVFATAAARIVEL